MVSAHALELASVLDPVGMQSLNPWLARFLTYGVGTGLYYVMGFFVISGYCIQLSVRRLSTTGGFPLKTYLLARVSRILPLYYVALFTTVITEGILVTNRVPVWSNGLNRSVLLGQIFVVQNFTQTYGSFAPSWSITNEVVYYALFGLLAALVARSKIHPANPGMFLCIAVGATSQLIYRTGYHSPVVLGIGLLFGLGFNWFLGALIALHADDIARSPVANCFTMLGVDAYIDHCSLV